jgi:hypothetical protein
VRRKVALATALALWALLTAQPVVANTLTPISKSDWAPNQQLQFRWHDGPATPAWMKQAVNAAAADSTRSRRAKAAVISYAAGSASWVAYSDTLPSSAAIAYASRNAPNSFKVWLRSHGHSFDWGVLRWCQFFDAPPKGCFDARTATLHEFGHVQGLGHTSVGPPDSIMYTTSLTKPKVGWDQHDFGACDVGAMQVRYEALNPATPISSCMSLATSLALTSSAASVSAGGSVALTATLRIGDGVAYPRLAGDPLSRRSVALQRRVIGGSWMTVGTMTPSAADGTYRLTLSPAATYEWRAVYANSTGEGLRTSQSSAVRVTVKSGDGTCTKSPCPV